MVLTSGSALKNLNAQLGGRLIALNVPEGAPPELPRVVLKLEDTLVNVGLNRFQITMEPPGHVATDFNKVVDFVGRRVTPVLEELLGKAPPYLWSGAIFALQFPVTSEPTQTALQIMTPIFDRLMAIDRGSKPLSALQLQFGFQEDEFFVTYTLRGYETRKLQIRIQDSSPTIDLGDIPIAESGVQISLDVNNKPKQTRSSPLEELQEILTYQACKFESLAEDLNLE